MITYPDIALGNPGRVIPFQGLSPSVYDNDVNLLSDSATKFPTVHAVKTFAETTAIVAAANSILAYKTLLYAQGSHTAGKVGGTYALGAGPLAVSGTGTLYPLTAIYLTVDDYPNVNAVTWKLRIRAQLYTNDVAPTGNFTFGLYPITRPAVSGGAGLCTFTIGTVVAGSNGAVFTTPVADLGGTAASKVGSDFEIPSDGHYIIAVLTTATVAANAHIHMCAQLQIHNV